MSSIPLNQLHGPSKVETSVSFYSPNMSLEEHSLYGYLAQYIRDQGLDSVNRNHGVLAIMVDDKLVMSVSSHDD